MSSAKFASAQLQHQKFQSTAAANGDLQPLCVAASTRGRWWPISERRRHAAWRLAALCLILLMPHVARAAPIAQRTFDAIPVYTLQGDGVQSAFKGEWVDAYGIVTGVTLEGFYLQDPAGDGNDATSDGIYVYTRTALAVTPGQCVRVIRGYVDEFYEKTELSRIKSVQPSSECAATPLQPMVIEPPYLRSKPVDLFERVEGMVVELPSFAGVVHGPTKRFRSGEAEIAVIPEHLDLFVSGGRIFQSEPEEMAALIYVSSALGAELPDVNVGDRMVAVDGKGEPATVRAILDYNFGKYQLLLLPGQTLRVESRPVIPDLPRAPAPDEFTVCSFNLLALGRGTEQHPREEEYATELRRRAAVIAKTLHGCAIIGLQEAGEPQDVEHLAAFLRIVFGLPYAAIAVAGPGTRDLEFPLTNSFLVRTDRVEVADYQLRQSCSPQDYGVEDEPGTCPVGQYPLFDRPPLLADLRVTGDWEAPVSLRVINNHLKSKGGDETVNVVRRERQAVYVASLVQELVDADPDAHAMVVGDLNDFYDSVPVQALRAATEPDLVNLVEWLPPLDRYTYIYNGGSQALDHILVTPGLTGLIARVDAVHISADFATPLTTTNSLHHASDHDPLVAYVRPVGATSLGGNLSFPGIRVDILDEDRHILAAAFSDAQGDVRIWGITPGDYGIRLTLPPHIHAGLTEWQATLGAGYTELAWPEFQHSATRVASEAALLATEPFAHD